MDEKLFGYTAEQWMFAALDMLDGNAAWWDIKDATGNSEERSKEISQMFYAATKDGWPKKSA